MNYKAKLEEKKLKKEDLTQKTQKKIDSLEALIEKIQESGDEITEEKADEYQELVESMDEEISQEIEKFNPDVYKKRLEVAAKAREARELKIAEPKVEKKEKVENKDLEKKSFDSLKEKKVETKKFDDFLEKERIENEDENEEFDKVEEYEPEAEEFEKKLQVKGTNLNKVGWGLFGLGLAIATFGGVIIWKNKQ